MRARIRETPLLDNRAIDVDAPVIFVVYFVAGAREKSADVAAEVENPATFPVRMPEQFIEIWELRQARRDKIPGERAAISEERLRRVDKSLIVVYGHRLLLGVDGPGNVFTRDAVTSGP